MTLKQNSSLGIVFILGLLAMLMPLSIDMYLPALPVIAAQYNVPDGSAQMTLSTYILGFALGQLLYGPMADSLGRKPVILGGTLVFAAAAVACALSQTVDMLIVMRFFHGLAAAAASVVINALMRDIYPKDEFSRMMSFHAGHDHCAAGGADGRRGGVGLVQLACHLLDPRPGGPAGLADDRPVYPRNAAG